ncbi:MAG TPA: hypothetical protein VK470_13190 [Bacteroidota bacterium]|nr:hypothetical protein [Bacteroidota bacterium]
MDDELKLKEKFKKIRITENDIVVHGTGRSNNNLNDNDTDQELQCTDSFGLEPLGDNQKNEPDEERDGGIAECDEKPFGERFDVLHPEWREENQDQEDCDSKSAGDQHFRFYRSSGQIEFFF